MRTLNYQLKQLCRRNQDGSRSTQATRERILTLVANELHELGFRGLLAKSLRPKHIEALTEHWRDNGISPGTQKNRMSAIRWWAEKINKRNVVARNNAFYGIQDRIYVSNQSKAKTVTEEQLNAVKDEYIRMSLRLQAAFGLRREEAIKLISRDADKGNELHLKSTWTKGGKARSVPIRNDHQRQILEAAKALAGRGSLIPPNKRYVDQLRTYERQTANAGLSKLHGLRHAYAQQRYRELTGWDSPAAGGPAGLTSVQREADQAARMAISRELGHERLAITNVYLGTG